MLENVIVLLSGVASERFVNMLQMFHDDNYFSLPTILP